MTKLTLSMEEGVVAQAKELAKVRGTSVSAMFTQFVKSVAKSPRSEIRPGRIALQASGLAALPPGKEYKELLTEALGEKFGVPE